MMKGFSTAEKEAFKTGAVRNIYATVMDPSSNINAAQRLIGSPEMKDRLMPLFPSQAKFDLFKAALDREHQLFQQANRIMAGSPSARRLAGIEAFDAGESAINAFVGNSITGTWANSLMNMAATATTKSGISDDVAAKVAKLLSSSKPEEVAAAVKILERNAAQAQRSVANLNRGETGAIMGAAVTAPGAPEVEQEQLTADEMLSRSRANQLDTSVADKMLEDFRRQRDGNIPGTSMVPSQ